MLPEYKKKQKEIAELNSRITALEDVENWKTLTSGFLYRKKGSNVEINVNYTILTTIDSYGYKGCGRLPEKYRPDIDIYVPIFCRNSATGTIYAVICLNILKEGWVNLTNCVGTQITFDECRTFLIY